MHVFLGTRRFTLLCAFALAGLFTTESSDAWGNGGNGPCSVDCSVIQTPECLDARCNAQTLMCEIIPEPNGTPCSLGVCQNGVCGGTGGNPGTGGTGAGGMATGGSANAAGSPPSGSGGSGSGGSTPTSSTGSSSDGDRAADGDCGCRLPGAPASHAHLVALLAAFAAARRRRRADD